MTRAQLILETIKTINTHYGRGTVTDINFNMMGRPMTATVHKQFGIEYPKITSLPNDFIRFRGVTRKLGYKIK